MNSSKIVIGMVIRGMFWGALCGFLLGALAGLPVFIIGAGFGAIIGVFNGLIIGTLSGLICGVITVGFFNVDLVTLIYRLVMATICAIITLPLTHVQVQATVPFENGMSDLAIAYRLSIYLGALFIALYLSQCLANWYIKKRRTTINLMPNSP